MDTTSFTELSIKEEDTGTVRLDLKGILTLNIFLSNLPVTDIKMTGYTINIDCGDKKSRARKTITAKSRTVVTEHPMPGVLLLFIHTPSPKPFT